MEFLSEFLQVQTQNPSSHLNHLVFEFETRGTNGHDLYCHSSNTEQHLQLI